MSQSELFQSLGAALANARWSRGAIGPNGSVILKVWQDQTRRIDGKLHARLTDHEHYKDLPDDVGNRERLDHVARIRSGADCYMVMCLADNTDTSPREIKSFNQRELFLGGRLMEHEGDDWIEVVDRLAVNEVKARLATDG